MCFTSLSCNYFAKLKQKKHTKVEIMRLWVCQIQQLLAICLSFGGLLILSNFCPQPGFSESLTHQSAGKLVLKRSLGKPKQTTEGCSGVSFFLWKTNQQWQETWVWLNISITQPPAENFLFSSSFICNLLIWFARKKFLLNIVILQGLSRFV